MNNTYTFTKDELETLLEEALREFVAYRSLYGDDTECAISNTVAGEIEKVELSDMFKQFYGAKEAP